MAAQLAGLKNLKTLALTNSVIGDPTVEMIVKSFPNLTTLDLSYNTNLTNSVLKTHLPVERSCERLTLVQNRFNDLGTRHLEKLTEAESAGSPRQHGSRRHDHGDRGDVAETGGVQASQYDGQRLRHGVPGAEQIAQVAVDAGFRRSRSQAGQYLAKLENLRELEIFRCQGFGSEGVLALKGMKLTRLQLRDLPMVDDQAMAVFEDLPELTTTLSARN